MASWVYVKRVSRQETIVARVLQRGGKVRTSIIRDVGRTTLHAHVREHVAEGSSVYTDKHLGYKVLTALATCTARLTTPSSTWTVGFTPTAWRTSGACSSVGSTGTYVSVKPFHLFRYLDERAFTYNERHLDDLGRFKAVLRADAGRRLTYAELTGRLT